MSALGAAARRPVRILSIIGTRPEAIKTAPVVQELYRRGSGVRSRVCVTGQHWELLDDVTELFGIMAHHDFGGCAPSSRPPTWRRQSSAGFFVARTWCQKGRKRLNAGSFQNQAMQTRPAVKFSPAAHTGKQA
jgi:hypothetical protein